MSDGNRLTKPVKPGKPRRNFPLSAHDNGQWYTTRRIGGRKRFFYFGEWADDPKGERAELAYDAVKAELNAGRQPTATGPAVTPPPLITAGEIVGRYMKSVEARVRADEIGYREFDDVRRACLFYFLDAVGERTPAERLATIDAGSNTRPLDRLRAHMSERLGVLRFNNSMKKIKRMLKWAYRTAKLITVPIYDDEALRGKKSKLVRRERRIREETDGKPIYTPKECRILVNHAAHESLPLFCQMLLAMNAGMSQSHISDLPRSPKIVNLDTGFVDWVRPKTEEICQFYLWPITAIALERYLQVRPKPKDPADDWRLFITTHGHPWVQEYVKDDDGAIGDVNPDDAIGKALDKLERRLGTKQRGRGFRAMRRTFSTAVNPLQDKDAIRRVMGHGLQGMDPHYVRKIEPWRLQAVTTYAGHVILGCVAAAGIGPNTQQGGSFLFPAPVAPPGLRAG